MAHVSSCTGSSGILLESYHPPANDFLSRCLCRCRRARESLMLFRYTSLTALIGNHPSERIVKKNVSIEWSDFSPISPNRTRSVPRASIRKAAAAAVRPNHDDDMAAMLGGVRLMLGHPYTGIGNPPAARFYACVAADRQQCTDAFQQNAGGVSLLDRLSNHLFRSRVDRRMPDHERPAK